MTAQPQPEPTTYVLRPALDSRPSPVEQPTGLRLLPDDPAAQPELPFGPFRAEPAHPAPEDSGDIVPVADARQWAATLAVAIFETLHGRRPIAQLTRWVDDRVQAVIAFHRRRSAPAARSRPAVLRSIRVQYPRPDAAEVGAHLVLNGRSYALALRLEIWGEHWLCTAVEFG